MIWHIHPSPAGTSRALLEWILQIADGTAGPVNIALSGGSTPARMFGLWTEAYRERTPWERIRFFWVDERCVPPDDPQSNYGMTKRNLLDFVPIPPGRIFRIRGEDDPDSEAHRYAKTAESLLPLSKGYPVFDFVLLGIGDDGHTASIFPGQETLLVTRETYSVGIHPTSGQRRVTLTGQPLLLASHLAFLATGPAKAKVLATLQAGPASGPAAYVAHHALHPAEIFIDNEAASLLAERPDADI